MKIILAGCNFLTLIVSKISCVLLSSREVQSMTSTDDLIAVGFVLPQRGCLFSFGWPHRLLVVISFIQLVAHLNLFATWIEIFLMDW